MTEGSIFTIVRRAKMQGVLQSGSGSGVYKTSFWVCLLLPLFLLHNPFLAAPNSSGTLTLQHPPSYRATIASSELLKFKNPEGLESIVLRSIAFVDWEFSKALTLAPPQTRFTRFDNIEDLLPPEQVLSSSLWFRPPPAA